MAPTNKLPNQNATTTMMDSYFVGNGGAVKRIGTPHEHDVLSGRGGAINSHPGNSRFREWVRERKNRYNLARTKAEKASVANEVMDLVRNQPPPGRFLQRDQSSLTGGVTWWVEVDDVKAMAKTSQALREGAPSIRAAHKEELTVRKRKRTSKKPQPPAQEPTPTPPVTSERSHQTVQPTVTSDAAPTMAPVLSMTTPSALAPAPSAALLSPSQAIEQLKANAEAAGNTESAPSYPPPLAFTAPTPASYELPPVKRSRLSENLYLPVAEPQPHIVKPDDETPPLAPLPSPVPLNSIPELGDFPMPAVPKRETSLRRANSLALSDIGSGSDNWDLDFVNPFEGDTSDEISSMPPPFDAPRDNSGVRSRNSISNVSVKSELSDLCDVNGLPSVGMADSEFGEKMNEIYDAVHPGLDSSGDNEPIPTHLYPYRGSYDLTKRSDSFGTPRLIC